MPFHRHPSPSPHLHQPLCRPRRPNSWQNRPHSTCDELSSTSRHAIPSGNNLLDAAYVEPVARAAARSRPHLSRNRRNRGPHGFPFSSFSPRDGVASLVFDYSGYGRSTGRRLAPMRASMRSLPSRASRRTCADSPISLLGFSLGSGVAAAIVNRVDRSSADSLRGPSHRFAKPAPAAVGLPAVARPIGSAHLVRRDSLVSGCTRAGARSFTAKRTASFPCRWRANSGFCCAAAPNCVAHSLQRALLQAPTNTGAHHHGCLNPLGCNCLTR